MLARRFDDVRAFRHFWREGVQPDFSDPYPSRLAPEDFQFEEVAPEELISKPTLTALFVAS